MNEVVASRADLERVAGEASDVADIAGTLEVGDAMSDVAGALPGATAGSEAVAAGLFIDGLAENLTAALGHFSEAVHTSAENYDETDQSASLVIREVLEELGE